MRSDTAVVPEVGDWSEGARVHRYFVCDVFTDRPLEGNQLAVFTDGRSLSTDEMQRLAREMNFAETVFVLPAEHGGDARIRIFMPSTELPFAGHPVLGAAWVVGSALDGDVVTLETGAGPVPIALQRDGSRITFGRMRQQIPNPEPVPFERELLAALGLESSELPVECYPNGPPHVYVALPDEQAVAALQPDMGELKRLKVPANCFAGSGNSWKNRMFYPAGGVPEDAATGSAAGPLAVHLARHGQITYGDEIEIRQGAEIGRPSVLHARVTGTADRIESVEVGGSAVIVAEGGFRITRVPEDVAR